MMIPDNKFSLTSMYESYEACFEYISRAEDKKDLVRAVSDFVASIGFRDFIYASFFPSEQGVTRDEIFIVSGYPEEWREMYDHKDYSAVDPVVLRCKRDIMPVKWSNLTLDQADRSYEGKGASVMDEAKEFGLAHGLTVPLHGIGREWSLLSIASSSYDDFFEHDYDPRLGLTYIALSVIHKVVIETLVEQSGRQSLMNSITAREREVIAWAAEGKTTWETSMIMGISESTVRFHLKNVTNKMGVSNKVSMVSKAILYGVL